jgi:hypothetical protein
MEQKSEASFDLPSGFFGIGFAIIFPLNYEFIDIRKSLLVFVPFNLRQGIP